MLVLWSPERMSLFKLDFTVTLKGAGWIALKVLLPWQVV